MGSRNFIGSSIFNVPKPAAEDEQKRIKWAELDKKIKNILIEHKDNPPKKLLELIKEFHKDIGSDIEFAIINLENSQKIVDRVAKNEAKKFPKNIKSRNLELLLNFV